VELACIIAAFSITAAAFAVSILTVVLSILSSVCVCGMLVDSWVCHCAHIRILWLWHACWHTSGQRHTCLYAYINWPAPYDVLQHNQQDFDVVSVHIIHCANDHLARLACLLLRSAISLHIRQTASLGNCFCWHLWFLLPGFYIFR